MNAIMSQYADSIMIALYRAGLLKNIIDVAFDKYRKLGRGYFLLEYPVPTEDISSYTKALKMISVGRVNLNYQTVIENNPDLETTVREYDVGHSACYLIKLTKDDTVYQFVRKVSDTI